MNCLRWAMIPMLLLTLAPAAIFVCAASDASINGTRRALSQRSNLDNARRESEQDPLKATQSPPYESIVLRGKVIEVGPYLLQTLKVPMDDDVANAYVALATNSGELHPLIKDVRARGFWMDKRLRDREMELHVHKFPGVPFVRLMAVFGFKDGQKVAIDYWCSVCAIVTYEPGPCPCCQDDIELRETPAK